jgi:hypothetical protein
MRTSESISKISAALLAAQKSITFASKDATNPHFKNKYADLPAVIEAIKGPLNDAGIAFMQTPSESGSGTLTLTTRLMHESGEWIEDTATIPLPKNDPQGYGSAMTYGRRYALAAITGLYQDDDDGNAAMASPKEAPAATVKPMSESEVEDCKTVMAECDDIAQLQAIFAAAYNRADKPQKAVLKTAYDKRKTALTQGQPA